MSQLEIPEHLKYDSWSEALKQGTLLGQECADCGHQTAAPKAACVRCGSRDIETIELETTGEVYSETTIAVSPVGFEAGYKIAIVHLGEAKAVGRVSGDVEIGDTVTFSGAFEHDGQPTPQFEVVSE
ncbi:Zn-ribbon domain-containing OB-fold protein [Haladaptatus sp. GCM10025707]|uniref:Zn-ribbon domain-containing OB-fold protein n=1 Tax=unclassified Haladaptatus TaxID=2622732 RepID=UPI0023E7B2D1|nr:MULTISPECIES: zinc ribbon domain-containing protein [unclassified Haladaptatus]